MTENTVFRPLTEEEVDDAFAIYLEVFDWLKVRGVRQWLTRHPRSEFADFQKHDQLYGLFHHGELAATAFLHANMPPHWQAYATETAHLWIEKLALKPAFRGRQLGVLMIAHLKNRARELGAARLCLDCIDVKGVMPAYYEKLGFGRLAARNVTYPNGNTFPVVFMEMDCGDERNPALRNRLRCGGSRGLNL